MKESYVTLDEIRLMLFLNEFKAHDVSLDEIRRMFL
jgi:hypothetical protein